MAWCAKGNRKHTKLCVNRCCRHLFFWRSNEFIIKCEINFYLHKIDKLFDLAIQLVYSNGYPSL